MKVFVRWKLSSNMTINLHFEGTFLHMEQTKLKDQLYE